MIPVEGEPGISPLRAYTRAVFAEPRGHVVTERLRVLSVGCGKGQDVEFLAESGRPSECVGVDAKEHPQWRVPPSPGRKTSPTFVRARAEELPFPEESFDLVVSSSSLEHVENDTEALRETHRVMRRGAVGLHVVPSVWALFLYGYHGYRRYSPSRLMDAFKQAGLPDARICRLGGIPSFLLHLFWITGLETGAAWEHLTLGRQWGRPLRLLARLRMGKRMREGRILSRLYARCLRLCLTLDPLLPFLPGGYAVWVRKPRGDFAEESGRVS